MPTDICFGKSKSNCMQPFYQTEKLHNPSNRLLSLDFMRGLIMVLLALESSGLYEHLQEGINQPFFNTFITQFFHHPWHGLRFWDLIQPAFMFMAGTAMALSLEKQRLKGVSWNHSFRKVLKRCGLLFFFGVLDYAVKKDGSLSFELWDVLTQLSFTTLIAFLIFRWSYSAQIIVCIFLLLLTEILYRYTNVPGFNQAFVDQHNFGNYMDLVLMNKINHGGWVAINCIPTAVHTIAGAMAGKYLLQSNKKVNKLVIWSFIALIIGFGLDITSITPIIKRIATSAFTLASLGYCLLALALIYWWIDIKNHKKHLAFFLIVGTNSLFIYLFFEIVGSRWFNGYVAAISNGLMRMAATPETIMPILTSLVIFALEWWLCYFLYKKKIFFKI
jgi:predicted acyltransferase